MMLLSNAFFLSGLFSAVLASVVSVGEEQNLVGNSKSVPSVLRRVKRRLSVNDIGSCPPNVTISPALQNQVTPNGEFQLRCKATGIPRPTVHWQRDDYQPLPNNVHDLGNGILQFKQMTHAMGGYYTCIATNRVGEANARALVMMQSPHGGRYRFVTQKYAYAEGAQTQWCPNQCPKQDCGAACPECSQRAAPPPTRCPNVFLPCTQQCPQTNCQPQYCPPIACGEQQRPCKPRPCDDVVQCPTCRPCLSDPVRPAVCPESVWCPRQTPCPNQCPPRPTCPTTTRCPIRTHVTQPIRCRNVTIVAPTAHCEPAQENLVLLGGSSELRCFASGNGTLKITWKRQGGGPLPANVHDRGNGILSVRHMEPSMAGEYECTVRGEHTHEMSTARCSIMTETALNVEVVPKLIEVDEGDRALFICIVTSNHRVHPISVVWSRRSGGPLPHGAEVHHTTLTIQHANRTDADDYICTASTKHEKQSSAGSLVVNRRELIVKINPEDNQVPLCGFYELRCVVSGSNCRLPLHVKWRRLHHPHTLPTNVTDNGRGVLHFHRMTSHTAGEYECVATTEIDSARKSVAVVQKSGLHVAIVPSKNNAVVGSHVELRCKATCNYLQPHTFTWSYNHGPLRRDVHSDDTGRLIFERVDHTHAGRYTCTVSTDCETITADATLTVSDAPPIRTHVTRTCEVLQTSTPYPEWPIITEEPFTPPETEPIAPVRGGTVRIIPDQAVIDVRPNDRIQLECVAEGPDCQAGEVRWIVDAASCGGDVPGRPSDCKEAEIMGRFLIISHFAQNNEGRYTCYVLNNPDCRDAFTDLKVQRQPVKRDGDMQLEIRPSIANFREGDRETLKCLIKGPFSFDAVTIMWSRRDGMPFPANVEDRADGILLFYNIKLVDAGEYVCEAYDKSTREYSTESMVVYVSPKLIPTAAPEVKTTGENLRPDDTFAPRAEIALKNIKVPRGQDFELGCSAQGTPKPTITWAFKNETNTLLPTAVRDRGDGVLRIEGMHEAAAGKYFCIARNPYGEHAIAATIELRFASAAIEPALSELDVETGKAVNLQCESDTDGVASYWVSYGGRCQPQLATYPNCKDAQLNGDQLTIEHFYPPNAGIYECVAEREGKKEDSKKIELRVKAGRKIRRGRHHTMG